MARPPRNKKAVNYSDFMDDNDADEDFAPAKAPPNKKVRASGKECQPDKTRINEPVDSAAKARKDRVCLDDKLFQRDLETALIMSQLQSAAAPAADEKSRPCDDVPPVLTHFSVDSRSLDDAKPSRQSSEDAPPVLSNCSVDVGSLGLDRISSDQAPLSAVSLKRKSQKTTEQQIHKQNEEDDDYRPQNTPESESEFSDPDESEDEEYTVKRKQEKRKSAKKENRTPPKSVKEKKPVKPTKNKPQSRVKNSALNSPGVKSPSASQPLSTLSRTPSTPPTNKTSLHTSPAGGRITKWTPPGLVGRSSSSCQSPPLKSPGLGLRLGLSRMARVKPLHPNAIAH